jgi:hypothetical protein
MANVFSVASWIISLNPAEGFIFDGTGTRMTHRNLTAIAPSKSL